MTDEEQPNPASEARVEAAPGRPTGLRAHLGLILTLALAAALAVIAQRSGGTSSVVSTSAPAAASEPLPTSGNPLAPTISGKIVERLDVPNYTYLALDTGAGESPTWVAVTSTNAGVGENVRVLDAQLMTNFASATLKRTFASIYFGMLENGQTPQSGVDPHAGVEGAPPLNGRFENRASPHPAPTAPAQPVRVGSIAKAEGPSGRTVRETFSERAALAGKSVRVRGVVVKVVSGVLGRSFVHVRDGSETQEVGDLLVTTRATPAVGERVLFEGNVTVDKDFGAGYSYPVLLEDAVQVGDDTRAAPKL